MSEPSGEPPRRFPARRLAVLLGVLFGALYLYAGVAPAVTGRGQVDSAQAALGLAILVGSVVTFWRYHG